MANRMVGGSLYLLKCLQGVSFALQACNIQMGSVPPGSPSCSKNNLQCCSHSRICKQRFTMCPLTCLITFLALLVIACSIWGKEGVRWVLFQMRKWLS